MYNRILLSDEKKQTSDSCNNVHASQIYFAKWKKPDSKGYVMYDSISIGKGKTVKQKTNLWLPSGVDLTVAVVT